jgi:excisionase family DNA binding protein
MVETSVSQSTISKRSNLLPATYTLSELAALLGISYTSAHEMAQRDALPVAPIRVGRQYRFPRTAVHKLLGIDGAGEQVAA